MSEQAVDSTPYSKVLVSFFLILESLGRSIQTISSPKGGRLAELGRDRATLELCCRAVGPLVPPSRSCLKPSLVYMAKYLFIVHIENVLDLVMGRPQQIYLYN